jgi:DNA polymerase III subunit epsilon
MYAIIDIETTGGNPKTDRITEIAVLIHDGTSSVQEYATLINPECRIPYHISALTGITNEMVADAPKFFEIARELVLLTQDKIFVAHNVAFDYGFIRNEFKRLGYDYKRDQLCTVRLSRKLIPGHRSYSLGRLCDALQISINGRHRALGDATATSRLFDHLLEKETLTGTSYIRGASRLVPDHHPSLDLGKVKNLPEDPGVYYFYNQEAELIYIGKSRNIKSRVLSHFSNSSTSKAMKMRTQIADVGFESTGNELIALLKESFEIKQHKPLFNRRQRRSLFRYCLCYYYDNQGYIRLILEKTTHIENHVLASFTAKAEAHGFLHKLIDKFELCQKLCGLYPSPGNCFHYEIGACRGACIGNESSESYNRRAMQVISRYDFGIDNLLIVDSGRNQEERSVVKIEKGKFIGFGYFTAAFAEDDQGILHECIHPYPDNREVQQIIRQYLRNNKVHRLVVY